MNNIKLLRLAGRSGMYIAGNILLEWMFLLMETLILYGLSIVLSALLSGIYHIAFFSFLAMMAAAAAVTLYICARSISYGRFCSYSLLTEQLREMVIRRTFESGGSRREAEAEDVELFAKYLNEDLPRLVCFVLAPLTQAAVVMRADSRIALLLCALFFLAAGVAVCLPEADRENTPDAGRRKKQLASVITEMMICGGAAFGMITGIRHLQAEQLTLSGCLTVIFISMQFFRPLRTFSGCLEAAAKGREAGERILRLCETGGKETSLLQETGGTDLRAEHLSCSYDGRKVISDISFALPQKGLTVISGSGKAALAELLCGRRKEYEGSLLFGGTEIRQLDNTLLREQITYVSSQEYFFRGTVRENLLMTDPGADDEMLWDAARLTGLDSFLKEKEGLDTEISSGGNGLRREQIQEMAVCRALLHRSPVMIFDEVPSGTDGESEKMILNVIHMLAADRCVIMFSRQPSWLKEADMILVIGQDETAGRAEGKAGEADEQEA